MTYVRDPLYKGQWQPEPRVNRAARSMQQAQKEVRLHPKVIRARIALAEVAFCNCRTNGARALRGK